MSFKLPLAIDLVALSLLWTPVLPVANRLIPSLFFLSQSHWRFLRHDNHNRLIGKALISAGFPNSLEPLGLLNANCKRPDGMCDVLSRRQKTCLGCYRPLGTPRS
ncbi:unnamed protein product [Gordionus sp. m RMFG-2023]